MTIITFSIFFFFNLIVLCFIFSLQFAFVWVVQWANVMNVFNLIVGLVRIFCVWQLNN